MFKQENNDEKKLDWMYKGPNSNVNREEYLLGRPVDKTLDNINEEEKEKRKQLLLPPPKSRVEHECIPPSIRDFNKMVQSEQVDLSAKLQEDPLVTIKKREEESRRQFLQNPVQLKKLQKALKAQEAKKNKKKKKKAKESELEAKLMEKLLGKSAKKASKEERDLDIILMHKYEALKHKLTQEDMNDILNGKLTDTESDDDEPKKKKKKKKKHRSSSSSSSTSSSSDEARTQPKKRERKPRRYSTDSENDSKTPKNYGLVNSKGAKIKLTGQPKIVEKYESKASTSEAPKFDKNRAKRLSEREKDELRRKMMSDAVTRDKDRERNLKKYRATEDKERREHSHYDPEFAHKQFIRSAQSSSIESRIKSNVNHIQRSNRDMDKNFSRRH